MTVPKEKPHEGRDQIAEKGKTEPPSPETSSDGKDSLNWPETGATETRAGLDNAEPPGAFDL